LFILSLRQGNITLSFVRINYRSRCSSEGTRKRLREKGSSNLKKYI